MNIRYATSNEWKVRVLRHSLRNTGVTVEEFPIETPELRSDSVVEIVARKAEEALTMARGPVVAMDAGFFIPALNGFPGTYMNSVMPKIGPEGILRLLAGKDRTCIFRQALAYSDPLHPRPHVFVGEMSGLITTTVEGADKRWSFNNLFIPAAASSVIGAWTESDQVEWYASIPLLDDDGLVFTSWVKALNKKATE